MNKLFKMTSVIGIIAALGACSSSHETKQQDVKYTQTHVKDDVTHTSARMHQVYGDQDRMGEIKFKETDAGLKMTVDLYDTRPGVEYKLQTYDMYGSKRDLNMPMVKANAKGKIEETFLVRGLSAGELKNGKIALIRNDAKGNAIKVGHGDLK